MNREMTSAGSGRITRTLGIFATLLGIICAAQAQVRPYIGYVYPAGGQQGATVRIRLGGQGVDDVQSVLITGPGVTARIAENYRRLNFQEMQLLNEQLRTLKKETLSESARTMMLSDNPPMMSEAGSTNAATQAQQSPASSKEQIRTLIDKIEKRTSEFVPNPASQAIASLVLVEITVAANAEPGQREIRLVTLRGISNPLPFYVGTIPEHSRKPMQTATQQVLGKESQALRRRVPTEIEDKVTIPCTLNGQIASGEVNRYRFDARKGQRLVMTTLGRQLVPFIADAVPGWFQPVLVLYDSAGKEVAYDDDFQFNPDPTLYYEAAKDGEYVLEIRDSLYRGREDFVYRITVGELPFITSISPLGAKAGTALTPKIKGWNLQGTQMAGVSAAAKPGIQFLSAKGESFISNPMPFAVDTLPEVSEKEPNNTIATAQKISPPVIINGRIDKPDDWDVFRFEGKSNDTVVVESSARRLNSPLDSVVKLTDGSGSVLAFNDDHEDLAAGLNTHQADSYLTTKLPADGTYYVHLGDTSRHGGEDYGYRLRVSPPQPDFELRVVPSSIALRAKSSGTLTVYAQRKDGFNGPIKLALKNPPPGFSSSPVTLSATQTMGRISIKSDATTTQEPVSLSVVGTAKTSGTNEIVREAVPAEDRMQAFLWRHLVSAQELKALVFDPAREPTPKRIARARPRPALLAGAAVTNAPTPPKPAVNPPTNSVAGTNAASATNAVAAPKFTKQQVAARLRQLKILFEEGMLTDDFYDEKVAECETSL